MNHRNLTENRRDVLMAIRALGSPTGADVVGWVDVHRDTVYGSLSWLKDSGMVKSRTSLKDARHRVYTLTEKGETAIEQRREWERGSEVKA